MIPWRLANWRILLAIALLAAVASCGVPTEDSARTIDTGRGVAPATPTPAVAESGPATQILYFIKETKLIAVPRPVAAATSVDGVIKDLLTGPNETERDSGISSALQGSTIVGTITVAASTATVELTSSLESSGRTDDVLAFAQIVCTLGNQPGITQVVFTHDSQRIGVPRADGSLTSDPLTPADYASLIRS